MTYGLTNAGGAAIPDLGTKTITANGTYSAATDGLDGYSEVTANVQPTYAVNAINLTSSELGVDDRAIVDLEPATQATDTTTALPSTSYWADTCEPFGRTVITATGNGTVYKRDLASNVFVKITDNLFDRSPLWVSGMYDSESGLSIFKRTNLQNNTFYSTQIDPANPYLLTRETDVSSTVSPLCYGFYNNKGSAIIKDGYSYTIDSSQTIAGIFMVHKYAGNYYAFGFGPDHSLRILSIDTEQHTMSVVATFSNYTNLPIISHDTSGRYVISWGGDVIDMTTYSITDSLKNYHSYDNISFNGIIDKVVFSWADTSSNPPLLKYEVWDFNNGIMTKDSSYDTTNYPSGANSYYSIDASGSLTYCSTDNGVNLLHYRTIAKPSRYTAKPFSQISDNSVIGSASESISAGSTGNVIVGTLISPTVTATNNSSYDRIADEKVWLNENNGSYEIINANSASSASFTGVCKEAIAIGASGTVEATVGGTLVTRWVRDFTNSGGTVDDVARLFTSTAYHSLIRKQFNEALPVPTSEVEYMVKIQFTSNPYSGAGEATAMSIYIPSGDYQSSGSSYIGGGSSSIQPFCMTKKNTNGTVYNTVIGPFQLNTWYWFRQRITTTNAILEVSTDGVNFSGGTSLAFDGFGQFANKYDIVLGDGSFKGIIDLAETYLKVDGNIVWQPYKPITE